MKQMDERNLHNMMTDLVKEQESSLSFEQVWETHLKTNRNTTQTLNYPRRKKWGTAAAVAGITVVGLTSAGFVSPTVASVLQQVPFLSGLYQQPGIIYDRGWDEIDRLGLSNHVHYAVKDQGITLNITDVFYDGARMAIGYELQMENSVQEKEIPMIVESKIKGVKTDFMMVDSTANEKVGENVYRGAITITSSSLPDNFTVNLAINNIAGKEGKWDVSVPVDKKSMARKIKELNPSVTATYKDYEIHVKKVMVSPVSTEVLVEATGPKGTWDKLNLNVKDDWGSALEGGGGGGEDFRVNAKTGRESLTHRMIYGPLSAYNPKPQYLVLIPGSQSIINPKDIITKEIKATSKGLYPLQLDGGEFGTIKIIAVEQKDNKTLVHYELDHMKNLQLTLILQDQAGKEYGVTKIPQRTKKEPVELIAEYPVLPTTKGLTFHAILETVKNQENPTEIKIPLNW
ncbi:DUF4179 domain-containing protein [Brevibacillus ginsengisoli]|uniref:DUF4179 domain-containing protein n=1 Tax=Brevibacillus ginsengisoli TaxID=363854 RepID=UPI003CF1FE12